MIFLINYCKVINKQKVIHAPYVWFASLCTCGVWAGGGRQSEERAQAAQAEVSDGITESGPLRMKQGLFSAVANS